MRQVLPAAIAAILLAAAPHALADPSDVPSEASADPNFSAAQTAIGAAQWQTAITLLHKVKPSADAHNLLGFAYRNAGKLDEAFKNYHLALSLNPGHRGAHEYLGEAYLMAKNPAKAEEHLELLKGLCTMGCEEYNDLARSIAAFRKQRG